MQCYNENFTLFSFPEAVPGNIRQAEHFVNFMRRFIEYLKVISTCFLLNIVGPLLNNDDFY